jgi:hypothetical protein
MWNETPGTVLMDSCIGEKTVPVRRIDRTGTKEGFPLHHLKSGIVKTKIGTGAKIAVEFSGIMAFFILCIKGTEIWFVFYHIFKSEIFDYLVVTEVS